MSNQHLREDKECQNCGFTVEVAYCSKCGQKNTETRQPFHHLFAHFVEDLVHYDGAFWKTIKYLLFRPAKLTREYLQGYRQRFVPPVKLYIFISFVTFFLMSMLTDPVEIKETTEQEKVEQESRKNNTVDGFSSVEELDLHQKTASEDKRLNYFEYMIIRATLNISNSNGEYEELQQSAINTLPKVLFLYMPVFAFWLWLFHSKKRWYFFDHGIFTLHYFSLLLLLTSINMIIQWVSYLISERHLEWVPELTYFISLLYIIFYFFRSHRKLYGEKKWISRLKSSILFFINIFCISITMIVALIYIFATLH